MNLVVLFDKKSLHRSKNIAHMKAILHKILSISAI